MTLIAILIPVTLLLAGCGLWGFFWAVRTGQFDDLESPGWEILIDERMPAAATSMPTPSPEPPG
jgi:cbb3-type cytochrome oxidase maturation protein